MRNCAHKFDGEWIVLANTLQSGPSYANDRIDWAAVDWEKGKDIELIPSGALSASDVDK